jgi:hypothetical protein
VASLLTKWLRCNRDDQSVEFEADGEEEDETRLRLTQLTRAVLFVGISVFAILSHFAPGLLVLTAILSVLLIAAPAHYANADSTTGLPGGKTQRSIPAVQLGLCLFISIFAGAAQFVPGVLVIFCKFPLAQSTYVALGMSGLILTVRL